MCTESSSTSSKRRSHSSQSSHIAVVCYTSYKRHLRQIGQKRRRLSLDQEEVDEGDFETTITSTSSSQTMSTTTDKKTTATTAKSVHFDDNNLTTVHIVEKIMTKYNRRHLWYSKPELERLNAMEVQRTVAMRRIVDTRHCDDLTWRGLEDHPLYHHYNGNDDDKDVNNKQANGRSHVRVMVKTYVEQMAASGGKSWDPSALCFISQTLSQVDRDRARHRGVQDAAAAVATTTTAVVRRRSSSISTIHSHSSTRMNRLVQYVFSCRPTTTNHRLSLAGYVGWVWRAVMMGIFCGLLIPPPSSSSGSANHPHHH